MNKPKIIFRADGNSNIGLGHVSRCCALADMLKDDFEIFFYTRKTSTQIIDDIKKYCTDVFILNDDTTYNEEALLFAGQLKDDEIVVLDGYNFDTAYQKAIKAKGCRLVCIDDIYAYHFVADVVINHAPGVDVKKYSTEPYTQLYLGAEYVLLKKEFLKEALKTDKNFDAEQSPVLICLGGADPKNFTLQTLEEVLKIFPQKKINVVVGVAYIHLTELQNLAEINDQIKLHQNIAAEEVLLLMRESHIAITSASTTALEYCCVKGILFLKCIADNQKNIYHALIEKNCAYPFEEFKENFPLKNLEANQEILIDGKSSNRLLKIFSALHVSHSLVLNTATYNDVKTYFDWANDPEVRSQSYNVDLIKFDDHQKWFQQKLSSKHSVLNIFKAQNTNIGQVRFDILKNKTALIDYSVDKNFRGAGIGTKMLEMAIKKFKEKFPVSLIAHVNVKNVASIKIFEKLKFKVTGQMNRNNNTFIIYEREL